MYIHNQVDSDQFMLEIKRLKKRMKNLRGSKAKFYIPRYMELERQAESLERTELARMACVSPCQSLRCTLFGFCALTSVLQWHVCLCLVLLYNSRFGVLSDMC